MEEALVCVGFYKNRQLAEIAKSVLMSNGISAVVSADDCGGNDPGMLPYWEVKLLVHKNQLKKSKVLLR